MDSLFGYLSWVKEHRLLTLLLSFLCLFVLPLLIVNVLFSVSIWPWNQEANGIAAFVGSVLAATGSFFLGSVALYQNYQLEKQNEKLAKIAMMPYEPRPSFDLMRIYESKNGFASRDMQTPNQNYDANKVDRVLTIDEKKSGFCAIAEIKNTGDYPINNFSIKKIILKENGTSPRVLATYEGMTVKAGYSIGAHESVYSSINIPIDEFSNYIGLFDIDVFYAFEGIYKTSIEAVYTIEKVRALDTSIHYCSHFRIIEND